MQGTEVFSLGENDFRELSANKSVPAIMDAAQNITTQHSVPPDGRDAHAADGKLLTEARTQNFRGTPVMLSRCGLAHSMVEGIDINGRGTEQALLPEHRENSF